MALVFPFLAMQVRMQAAKPAGLAVGAAVAVGLPNRRRRRGSRGGEALRRKGSEAGEGRMHGPETSPMTSEV